MDTTATALLIGALLLFGAIVVGAFSSRFGVPFLLVFLLVGVLAGEDGPGGIEFDDYRLSFVVGNLALAIILLDGGLRTKLSTFRVALWPSLGLASVGVLLSAAGVAAIAAWLLDLDWRLAALLGAIVGSTDAAAVFALLKSSGTRLNERVASTLEIESGVNDPMAIFLTITLIELLMQPAGLSGLQVALELVRQFGLGAVIGVALGFALSMLTPRIQVGEGLNALLLCSGGVAVFGVTNLVGGSGFLAVYLTGLVLGNRRVHASEDVMRAMDGMAWLAQAGMFLLLGLLATPRELAGVAGPAIAVAAALMFVIRPAAVALVLLPFRFSWRETAFIGWVGLRGAVPIVLAIFPLLAGVPGARQLFDVAFVVVLASLLLQGTTIAAAARRFGVGLPERASPIRRAALAEPGFEIVEFRIVDGSSLVGLRADALQLPAGVSLIGIMRGGRSLASTHTPVQVGDTVVALAAEASIDALAALFTPRTPAHGGATARLADFVLDGAAPLADVCALYGRPLPPEHAAHSIAQAMAEALPRAVEGDEAQIAGIVFVVRQMDGDTIRQVSLRLGPR